MIKRLTYFISVLMLPAITLAYIVSWTTPTTSVSYNTGETVVLEWTTDAPGVYGSIALYQGMDINNLTLVQTIESNFYFTSGSQSYSWTIPSSVSTGSDYRIKFTIGAQSFNSSFFSINSAGSGVSGHSLSFDGVDDYVRVLESASFPVGTSDFTFSAWIELNTIDVNSAMVVLCNQNLDHFQFAINANGGNGNLDAYIGGTGSWTPSQSWTPNQWYYITVVRENGIVKFYRDGIYISESNNNGSIIRSALDIGYRTSNSAHPFNGNIYEVCIWNDALSTMEVAALYNSGNPLTASTNSGYYTSSNDLVSYWQMNEGSGAYTTDGSGNGNSGTIYGATWSTDTPGSTSSSYITIASARTQGIGASITVRGIVTTPNYTSSSGTALAIQDGTAGISIYSPSISNFLAVGDSVQVSGTRQEFNNKIQIWPGIAADITVISSNNPLPAFQVVTVANFVANGEDYESELIRINGVSITSGTWPTAGSSSSLMVSDDGGTSVVMLHIDSDTDIDGNSQPSSPFDVQGDAGQYYNDYQLRPRYYTDFNPTSSSSGDDDGSIELLTGSSENGVSGNEQGYPLNSYYHDVKHQSLYWASDLADAGILSGSSITGIKLKVNQTPGMNLDSVRIAYSWTSNTQISTFDLTTTVVHGPTNYYAGDFLPNNWVQFNFSTPVSWDGVSNLIIEYSHDNNAYVSGGTSGSEPWYQGLDRQWCRALSF